MESRSCIMAIQNDLLAIEKGFWTSGADYYRQNLDDVCLTAFTEMVGAFKKEEIAGMMKEADRWRDLSLDVKGCLEPAPGFAVLTYQVRAKRKGGEPYAGVVSSGYVMRNGAWKMVFHQQTPLDPGKQASKPS